VTYKLGHEVFEVRDRSKAGVVIAYKTPDGETEDAHFDDLILAVGEYTWSILLSDYAYPQMLTRR